jgi:hypothetical protein
MWYYLYCVCICCCYWDGNSIVLQHAFLSLINRCMLLGYQCVWQSGFRVLFGTKPDSHIATYFLLYPEYVLVCIIGEVKSNTLPLSSLKVYCYFVCSVLYT